MSEIAEAKSVAIFTSEVLSNWIKGKSDSWWLVDGESALEQAIVFPCESEVLADKLASFQEKKLLALKYIEGEVEQSEITNPEEIEGVFDPVEDYGGQGFYLRWSDVEAHEKNNWLLVDQTEFVKDSLDELPDSDDEGSGNGTATD